MSVGRTHAIPDRSLSRPDIFGLEGYRELRACHGASRWLATALLLTGLALGFLTPALPAAASPAPLYQVTGFPGLPGPGNAFAINDFGQVAGNYGSSAGLSPFLWTPSSPNGQSGTTTLLATQDTGVASSINNGGEVSGYVGTFLPYVWRPSSPNSPTVTASILPDTAGTISAGAAFGINDAGQISGEIDGWSALWQPDGAGGYTADWLNFSGNPTGTGRAINNAGQITGFAPAGSGVYHAFLWNPSTPNGNSGTYLDLNNLVMGGTGGVTLGEGQAINAYGQIAGNTSPAPGTQPYVWTPAAANGTSGTLSLLPLPSSAVGGLAEGLDDAGHTVGAEVLPSTDTDACGVHGAALLWTPSISNGTTFNVQNLNDLIPSGTGWDLTDAKAINARGQIVGTGCYGGQQLPFLLTPTAVPNTPPNVAANQASVTVNEGQTATNAGTVADTDGDTVTLSASFGSVTNNGDGTWSWSFATNDGPAQSQTVTITADDGQGGSTQTNFALIVDNVAPTVTSVTGPSSPQAIGTAVSLSGAFTDPGTLDTHTASWDWGDGTTSSGTVTESNGSGTVSDSHTYTATNVYTVTLTVTDKDGGVGSNTFQYVVVYDSSVGFVTGGGWINSPAGACLLTADCGTATGKATFGFVAKYQKGANVPTGNTEFRFQAGNLDFQSTSYQWLVVNQNGTDAQFKGIGTINGTGSYTFIIWATSGSPDTFRIQITDSGTGATVYDNGVKQPLGGGSIAIHS